MRISVGMGTFNGERYLQAQLASIADQTRPPDELVVSDDCSSDRTLDIVEEFARSVAFPVDLSVAPRHLGVTRNYERVVRRCQGEVIVLSDQDDVWRPDRLARIEATFADSPSVVLAFSDAELVASSGRPLGRRLWDIRGFHRRHQRRFRRDAFGQLMGRSIVSGCTMAFRASARQLLLPFPADEASTPASVLIHDRWISIVLGAAFDVELIPEPLVAYRMHAQQRIGIPGLRIRRIVPPSLVRWGSVLVPHDVYSARMATMERVLSAVSERMCRLDDEERRGKALAHVAEAQAHVRARATLPNRRLARIPRITGEALAGRYHRYSLGAPSMLGDFLRRPARRSKGAPLGEIPRSDEGRRPSHVAVGPGEPPATRPQ